MGITLVKTNYLPISFGRGRIHDLQLLKAIWRDSTIDVSYFRPYAETKNNAKSAWNGFNLDLISDHVALKSQVLLSRSFIQQLFYVCFFRPDILYTVRIYLYVPESNASRTLAYCLFLSSDVIYKQR